MSSPREVQRTHAHAAAFPAHRQRARRLLPAVSAAPAPPAARPRHRHRARGPADAEPHPDVANPRRGDVSQQRRAHHGPRRRRVQRDAPGLARAAVVVASRRGRVEDDGEPRARRVPGHVGDVDAAAAAGVVARRRSAVVSSRLGQPRQVHGQELREEARRAGGGEVRGRERAAAAGDGEQEHRAAGVAVAVAVAASAPSRRRHPSVLSARVPLRGAPPSRLPHREPAARVRREQVPAARRPQQLRHAREAGRDARAPTGAHVPDGDVPAIRAPRGEERAARVPRQRVVQHAAAERGVEQALRRRRRRRRRRRAF
eukprot:31232-Pelagococcus_subviridis.AAC.10